MAEVEYIFDEKDSKEDYLEDRSPVSMSWFTGVILPGPSMHWIIMNALISCDRNTGDHLRHLNYKYPNSGFQYRGNTYWSWQCILGKVLGAAKGVTQIAGWVGPCCFSSDLKRIEVVHIKQPSSIPRLSPKEVSTMAQRSDPLGRPDTHYPVADYELLTPDTEEISDSIRVEKLRFLDKDRKDDPEPHLYSVAVQFAVQNHSHPVRLSYDVSFIAAYPCHSGPHVLFYDFAYRAVKVDDLVDMRSWGPHRMECSTPGKGPTEHEDRGRKDSNEVEEVLVIEALGVEDNEVFARAWCSHWGVSAVTACLKKTCMACAIREAYAACVTVLILTDGGRSDD
ncbi:MAG: hypothetical protein M1835_001145 [Candelina submexicana]|nr:MAG: hypothetical protein M1835_001145 [Candelina submexicana]